MVSVSEAEKVVLGQARDYGNEIIDLELAVGRVLAEDIYADRPMPAYDRVTMDGYAVKFADFASGQRVFSVQAVQAAGAPPMELVAGSVVQVMTGAVLPIGADTIVPVEETETTEAGIIITNKTIRPDCYIHRVGSDTAAGQVVVPAGQLLSDVALPLAASVGKIKLAVRAVPKVAVITSGDELVPASKHPLFYQIRGSNDFAAAAALKPYSINADRLHMPDDPKAMGALLRRCLKMYDVIIISGGVSKGLYDYVPVVLTDLSVKTLFHGVAQKPGKPLLLGTHPSGTVVFACPGNPVSTMLCTHKYVIPWLRASLGVPPPVSQYAVLDRDVSSPKDLRHFVPVTLRSARDGVLHAKPIDNNGSGDFLSLLKADAFIELPASNRRSRSGRAYKTVPLRTIL